MLWERVTVQLLQVLASRVVHLRSIHISAILRLLVVYQVFQGRAIRLLLVGGVLLLLGYDCLHVTELLFQGGEHLF